MEVKMQTSFIPKKPIVENQNSGSGVSLFLLLSIIVFIVTVALAGGVWLWRESLISQIEKKKQELVDTKNSFEEDTINALIRLDDRIKEANRLLAKHLAITPVFTLLEKYTVRNVQLKSLKFSYGGPDKVKLDLVGVARDYDALSKQSDIFGSEILRKAISAPVVSDFNLNPDGTVSFNFSATVASKLISYEESRLISNSSVENTLVNNSMSTSTATSTATSTNNNFFE